MALLETIQSPVHDLRLMMGKLQGKYYIDLLYHITYMSVTGYDGKSRGFAFCTFIEEDGCKKCKEKLDGYEFMGKKMVVNISTPATRLFVGSIPKDKTKEQFETEFKRIGVDNVSILFHRFLWFSWFNHSVSSVMIASAIKCQDLITVCNSDTSGNR